MHVGKPSRAGRRLATVRTGRRPTVACRHGTLVLTVIGDDRSGLVSALSGVIADHGGSWERSQMARLAGKFAGIVLVAVPDESAEALIAELGPLGSQGLLDVTVERGADEAPAAAT